MSDFDGALRSYNDAVDVETRRVYERNVQDSSKERKPPVRKSLAALKAKCDAFEKSLKEKVARYREGMVIIKFS
jgi:hypothetical protein